MEHFWVTIDQLATKSGIKCFLCYPSITDVSDEIAKSNIKLIELDLDMKNRSKMREIRKFIDDNEISTIYFTDRPYFNFKYWFLRLSGVKNIIVHDHTPGDRPAIGGMRGFIKSVRNRLPYVTADLYINVSKLMRKRSILNGRIPGSKCKVVQNGIPVRPIQKNIGYIRKELDIPNDAIVAVTACRIHPYKRVDFIVKAALEYLKKNSDEGVYFLIVGDGPDLPKISSFIEGRYASRIKLLGFRKDVWKILVDSNFAIHASLGEGFSLSIIEYMAAALPVLVPDVPSVSQAIDHMKNGIIYPKNDVAALIRSIRGLVKNNNMLNQMGNNARVKVEKYYSLDVCTEQFIDIIRPYVLIKPD